MQHLTRTDDFTKDEIEALLRDAKDFSDKDKAGIKFHNSLENKLIITLFLTEYSCKC